MWLRAGAVGDWDQLTYILNTTMWAIKQPRYLQNEAPVKILDTEAEVHFLAGGTPWILLQVAVRMDTSLGQ